MKNDFDYLRTWSLYSDEEIVSVVSDQNMLIMKRIVISLSSETEREQISVDRKNFVKLFRLMEKKLREGSNLLGEAIIDASEFEDNNQINKAIEVYKKFLEECDSKFYKNIARKQIKKLSELGQE